MAVYRVEVWRETQVEHVEVWEVEAENRDAARSFFDCGKLIEDNNVYHRSDYEIRNCEEQ